ncbi:hypothetical protein CBR_g51503 [Chara braunii]|uniref:Uncharacterized protein n=1 Tax=Chara braunii TaxID=69332 RepID=A0A388K6E0_CHABU|nr:hypothetical protein CBR_g51503 [Chara braunii]|eukprot:GBG65620.1 hypothetical protein CBR_g51503 [Chara braunii]
MVVCMVLAMAVVVDMLASELSVVVLFVEGNTAQHRFHLGPSECNPDIMTVVNAPFVAGRVTIDGLGNDWEGLPAQKMELMPATTLTYGDVEKHMPATLIIKGAHDGQNLYMLMSLPGKYVFNSSDNHLCPSVALMFAIGSRATFKSPCRDVVDIMTNILHCVTASWLLWLREDLAFEAEVAGSNPCLHGGEPRAQMYGSLTTVL